MKVLLLFVFETFSFSDKEDKAVNVSGANSTTPHRGRADVSLTAAFAADLLRYQQLMEVAKSNYSKRVWAGFFLDSAVVYVVFPVGGSDIGLRLDIARR